MELFTLPEEKPQRAGEVYTFSNGAKYVGAIRNGKMHGFGSYEDPSGSKYTGDWRDGRQHGQGVCETFDGEQYTGQYVDGLPCGKGVYKFKNGNVYEGEYKDGKIWGHGVIRFPDNRRFEGTFKDNRKNGHGRYEGANGIYEGNYIDGKKSGHGSFTWIDGSRYEGPWLNDLMDGGGGTKIEKDGRTFHVIYKMGKLVQAQPQAPASTNGAAGRSSPSSIRSARSEAVGSGGVRSKGFQHVVDQGFRANNEVVEQEVEAGPAGWLAEQWEEFNYTVLGCGGRRDRVIRGAVGSCGGPNVWPETKPPRSVVARRQAAAAEGLRDDESGGWCGAAGAYE